MRTENSILYYEERHNKKFPNSLIKTFKRIDNYIYFETKFGICKKTPSSFGRTNYNIDSAIDKTKYLQLQLMDKYGDIFDYSLVKHVGKLNSNITLICKTHGAFKVHIYSVLRREGNCPVCSKAIFKLKTTSTIEDFIKKANLVHNNQYDYSKTIYNGSINKLKITCPMHGEFEQLANGHLQGYGCKECGNIKNSTISAERPNIWSHTGWKESGLKSKNFDSFKVYIIECWENDEKFYKIGKTYLKLKLRFESKRAIPYKWKVIKIYTGEAKEMSELESKLKGMNKENKYLPKMRFGGRRECFTKIENYEETI